MKETIEKIKESIKPYIDQWKKDRLTFIKDLDVYCRHTVYEEAGTRDAYQVHSLKVQRGYTKSLERYFGRTEEDLIKMIEKDAEMKMFDIERAAWKKLKGVDVETVENVYFNDVSAAWKINNEKSFGYNVVIAGGYNVQCLHIRVLFFLK